MSRKSELGLPKQTSSERTGWHRWAVGPLAVLLVAACGGSSPSNLDEDGSNDDDSSIGDDDSSNDSSKKDDGTGKFGDDDSNPDSKSDAVDECTKVDIIFVIDDSGSMAPHQTNLANNFPKFVETIEGFRTKSGAKLDWRAAITTTTVDPEEETSTQDGDASNGLYRQSAKCGTTQRWIEGADPEITKKFSCLAKVGTGGSGDERPLEALKMSLEDRVKDGMNAGFRRDDALLATILLTDEDDGSDGPPESFLQMLDTAAHGPGRWALAAIASDNCKVDTGIPFLPPQNVTATKIKDLVTKAGSSGAFSSICPSNGDLTPALKQALDTFTAVCQSFKPPVN